MLFINFSNHPFAAWGEDQKQAAKSYGDNRFNDNIVIDIPFPNVPPMASRGEVEQMAKEAFNDIKERLQNFELMGGFIDTQRGGAALMLAGELSFCVALGEELRRLRNNRGGTVVHTIVACSERISKDLGDGKKETQFVFRQFRPFF